jgi:hypothetical protein
VNHRYFLINLLKTLKIMKEKNTFPLCAFTPQIKAHIEILSKSNQISAEIIASSILNAAGFVLSDSFEAYPKRDDSKWVERSNLWTIISLPTGGGKSVIMRIVFKPIIDFQEKLHKKEKTHNAIVSEWESLLKAKKVKLIGDYLDNDPELRNWLSKKGFNNTPPIRIKMKNIYADDFTFERLFSMLDDNEEHPLLIRADEMIGTFKSFTRYRQGNDEESLLKLWGYDDFKINRVKENGDFIIKTPVVSFFGATQNRFLHEIFNEERKINGNLHRFLLCVDDDITIKNRFEGGVIYTDIFEPFLNFYLEDFNREKNVKVLQFEEDAYNELILWRYKCKETYIDNRKWDVQDFNSIMAKMDSYVARISIIINRLKNYYGVKSPTITMHDVMNAELICEYYINEIKSVMVMTDRKRNSKFKNDAELDFYLNHLDEHSREQDATKLMEIRMNITRQEANSIFDRWKDDKLLKRSREGYYYKTV